MSLSLDRRIMPILFNKCNNDPNFIPFNEWVKKFSSARKKRIHNQWIKQDKKCFYCTRILTDERDEKNSYTFDHKIPVSKGGTEHPSNIIVACKKCNGSKSDMSFEEFHSLVYDEDSYNRYFINLNLEREKKITEKKKNIDNGILTQKQLSLCFTFIIMEKHGLINLNIAMKNILDFDANRRRINKKGSKKRRREKKELGELNFV